VTPASTTDGLLASLAPQVLGALVRRFGDFAAAEDAVQEALIAASSTWPDNGVPDEPLAWLTRVARRRLADHYRSSDARQTREELAASWAIEPPEPLGDSDDSLILMFMCCHPSLTATSAIPLTLRAVGGLTTREIAAAFLVPEATMAQRISRAKATVKASAVPFELPTATDRAARLASVLHVLYLMYNEGYATMSGSDLARVDLSNEAIRLTVGVHEALPDEREATGLLALMLLTDARRPARSGPAGELIPLEQQDRSRWNRALIAEGVVLITDCLRQGGLGEYQLQAAIAAVHDQAPTHAATNWAEIAALYRLLERMTANPMVTLNRAVAVAMVEGPRAGLDLLDGIGDRLGDHHRLHAVRAHLLEMAGDRSAAFDEFRLAAANATNRRERDYLNLKIAVLRRG